MTTREVVLDGGSPWGFRLHGGADLNQPLRISRVNPGSKAALRGIREGDFITSINNQSTKDISNAEAHSLLRNSGDTLKLGLNEDCSGSPKRRQYKTVHQETHSETVKKSSITSYTLTSSKTVSQTETSNDQKTSNANGNCINGDSINDYSKHPVASQRSTLSSNCSSSSTPSSYTEPLGAPGPTAMSDRTRRKRSRGHRRKTKNNNVTQILTAEVIEEEESTVAELSANQYRVESPKLAKVEVKKAKGPIKSKSLDDDDLVKIQELSEVSESEDKSECKAIVSEAESDFELELASPMEESEVQSGVLNSLSLPLETSTSEQVTLMSPEEELSLRQFLEGLNLVNSPEDAFRQVQELSTMESVKSRRAKKRAALEQYFTPIIQNPRYLDVINEESSDLSDREHSLTHHLKQGTPEPEVPLTAAKLSQKSRLQSRMQSHFPAPISNPAILVGTKIIEVPLVAHGVASSTLSEPSAKAEVVYLEDSSSGSTPRSDNEEDKRVNEEMLAGKESEVVEEKKVVHVSVKKDDVLTSTADHLEKVQESTSEFTSAPTPVDSSPKNGSTNSKNKNEESKSEISHYDLGTDIYSLSQEIEVDHPRKEYVIKIDKEDEFDGHMLTNIQERAKDEDNKKKEEIVEHIIKTERDVESKDPDENNKVEVIEHIIKVKMEDDRIEKETRDKHVSSNMQPKCEENEKKTETVEHIIKIEREPLEENVKLTTSNGKDIREDTKEEISITEDLKEKEEFGMNERKSEVLEHTMKIEREDKPLEENKSEVSNIKLLQDENRTTKKCEDSEHRIKTEKVELQSKEEIVQIRNLNRKSTFEENEKKPEVQEHIIKIEREVKPQEIKNILPSSNLLPFNVKDILEESRTIKKSEEKLESKTCRYNLNKDVQNLYNLKQEVPKVKTIDEKAKFEDNKKQHEAKEHIIKIEREIKPKDTIKSEPLEENPALFIKNVLKHKEISKIAGIEEKNKFGESEKKPEVREHIIKIEREDASSSNVKNEPLEEEKNEVSSNKLLASELKDTDEENKVTKNFQGAEQTVRTEKVELQSCRYNLEGIQNETVQTNNLNRKDKFEENEKKTEGQEHIIKVEIIDKPQEDNNKSPSNKLFFNVKDKFEENKKKPEVKEHIIKIEREDASTSKVKNESLKEDKTKISNIKLFSSKFRGSDEENKVTRKFEESEQTVKTEKVELQSCRSNLEDIKGETVETTNLNRKGKFEENKEKAEGQEHIIKVEMEDKPQEDKNIFLNNKLLFKVKDSLEENKTIKKFEEKVETKYNLDKNVQRFFIKDLKQQVPKIKNLDDKDKCEENKKKSEVKEHIVKIERSENVPINSPQPVKEEKIDDTSSLRDVVHQKAVTINKSEDFQHMTTKIENVKKLESRHMETKIQPKISSDDKSKHSREQPKVKELIIRIEGEDKNVPSSSQTPISKNKTATSTLNNTFTSFNKSNDFQQTTTKIEENKKLEPGFCNLDKNLQQPEILQFDSLSEGKLEENKKNEHIIKIQREDNLNDESKEKPKENIMKIEKKADERISMGYSHFNLHTNIQDVFKKMKATIPKIKDFIEENTAKEDKKKCEHIIKIEKENEVNNNDIKTEPKSKPEPLQRIKELIEENKKYETFESMSKKGKKNELKQEVDSHENIPFLSEDSNRKEAATHEIPTHLIENKKYSPYLENESKSVETQEYINKNTSDENNSLEYCSYANIKFQTKENRPPEESSKKPPEKLRSPSTEVEHLCTADLKPTIFTNALSPRVPSNSPSPSLSSGSSSRATSLCTAKYNPMTASLAEIEELLNERQPPSLRELCLDHLMSQPHGADVLQELAEVSRSIGDLTERLSEEVLREKRGLRAFLSEPDLSAKWAGSPSPTRCTDLEGSRKSELDAKHINRASYHDERRAEITSVEADGPPAIVRDQAGMRADRRTSRQSGEDRLKARDLNEWLRLARSSSETSVMDASCRSGAERSRRRTSLPQDFYEQQMRHLQEKEREIQRELERLEEEKRRLAAEMAPSRSQFQAEDFRISKRGDFAEKKSRPVSMPSTEVFRRQMYEEYMDKIAAMEERKQLKVIKVTSVQADGSSSTVEGKLSVGIEDEFMDKVKEKQKLGKLLRRSEDSECDEKKMEEEAEPVLVMDGESLKGARSLPKHLQEFVDITKQSSKNTNDDGVWSPGQKQESRAREHQHQELVLDKESKDEPISPVWTPKSATSSPTVERKEFRPVKFESPVLGRKSYSRTEEHQEESKEPPWKVPETSSDAGINLSSTLQKRLPTSHSSPVFNDFGSTRLPKAQNPTITLLQKAREGQLPKGALYIEQEQNYKRSHNDKPPLVGPGEILYKIKNEYASESDSEKPRKMVDLGPRKFEGIGPTTKDGMPLILRSEVKDANQSKWYKKMYDTIHKQRPHRDEFVTVRYKQRRGQYPYTSGYLSEPEPGAYDSDYTDYKYATLDRRRLPARDKENDYLVSSTMPRSTTEKSGDVIKHGHDPYKNQPGRIENYIPGHSSISEKEAKEWWDEVMDIFDGHLEQQKRVPQTKSFMNQALKESGYESDSTLVFRRRDDTVQQLSPSEQKEAYKIIQKGGDIPLHGLRKPAPERPKEPEPPVPPPKGQHGVRNLQQESPRKYVENEVTIHYKTPVRQEIKEYLSEDELAYRQAEAMKKIYQEERRRKYLQELQDMTNRRHTDNFIPSQKSPIPLNRYDDVEDLAPPVRPRPRSPEPRLVARALYNFVGQTARELTFRKGDLIYVRRQVDKNWYEGELNAAVGLFPVNYVEIVPQDAAAKSAPRKSHEGQARARYNFVAQTHLELSLAKGELVTVTRRVDDNWFEGRIGGRRGIFPVSYVEVLAEPAAAAAAKPVAAPAAHSLLLNGSAGGRESMGSHSYTPVVGANRLTSSYRAKPVQVTGGSYGSLNRNQHGKSPVNQALHVETQSEPVPYRALYKYLPQNDDELELLEGDTVYVLEKCDDGWYVGSSERTGAFGTFPGNYVEKI